MFIETDDISFLSTLKEHKAKQVVIHYCCQNCDDEQVTYEEEVTEEMISDFEEKKEHIIGIPCTSCGVNTLYLKEPIIQGVELM